MANKLLTIVLVSAVFGLASCTLSEPEEQGGNAADLHFTGLTSYGMTVMKVKYDDYGRMTEINYAGEVKYFMTYSGTSSVPVKIVNEDYEERWDYATEKDVMELSERIEWTDIEVNAQGYITKVSETDTTYSADGSSEVTSGTTTFEYDGNHLVRRYDDGELDMIYMWEDNLLISADEPVGFDHRETIAYDYSDVENLHRQWDPNNNAFGPIALTGLFGEAPAKFFKSETYRYDGVVESCVQYSYALLENGLINMGRVYDGEDGTIVYNFQYEKK